MTTTTQQVLDGKLSNSELVERLQQQAKRLQSVFYSETWEFSGNHWNTPYCLGKHLVETVQLGGHPSDAVERLFRAYCHELVPSVVATHKGRQSSDMQEVVGEELVERYRHFLVGHDLPHNYWGDERDHFPAELKWLRRRIRWPSVT